MAWSIISRARCLSRQKTQSPASASANRSGDIIDDIFRYLRKTWRRKLYGEEDFEARNVGFRLRINRKRFRRGVAGKGPVRFWKRPGSQLNPSSVEDPASGSRAIRERD